MRVPTTTVRIRGGVLAMLGWAALAAPAPAQTGCGPEGDPATPCRLTNGSYHALVPEGDGPFPVVIALHSSGETGADLVASEFYRTMLTAKGIALLAPNGGPQTFADGTEAAGWHLRQTGTGGRDDISFLETMMADAARRFPLDVSTALVTGYGLGASMAWETACLSPDTAFAYAPRNGGFYTSLPEACRGPFRLMHVHSNVEGGWPLTDPIEGAEGAAPQPVQSMMSMAAASLECAGSAPVTADLPEGHTMVAWTGCEEGADLRLLLHRAGAATTADTMSEILSWWEAARASEAAAGAQTDATEEESDPE